MEMKKLGVGVISTARIGYKVIRHIGRLDCCEVVALSSRTMEKVKEFEKNCEGLDESVKLYDSYGDVINDPRVDIVYIPLPTALRMPYVRKCAESKKHVLIEKPFLNTKEVEEIIELSKKHEVHIMDNTFFVHHTRTKCIEEEYLQKYWNELKKVHTTMSVNIPYESNIRYDPKLEPYGAIGDLGWYCAKSLAFCFKEFPIKVVATGEFHPKTNAVINFSGLVYFSKSRMGFLSGGFNESRDSETLMQFSGKSEMSIRIPYFASPLYPDIADSWNRKGGQPKMEGDGKAWFYVKGKNHVFKKITLDECVQVEETLKDFCEEIQMKRMNLNWLEQSLIAMKICDMVYESVVSGNVIDIAK